VICPFSTINDETGLQGEIVSHLPVILGGFLDNAATNSNGNMQIKCLMGNNPIFDGVTDFRIGDLGLRTSIRISVPKDMETQKHVIVGKYDDGRDTPLVVVKVPTEKNSQLGNIIVLNFWPVSSNLGSWWDKSTDGDILLQNAVCWAAKALPQEKNKIEFEAKRFRILK